MKPAINALLFLLVLTPGTLLHAGSLTIGTYTTGSCYPLMCNDSGTNLGLTMDYQQVYASGQFSGVTNINSLTFTFASQFGGADLILGGQYALEWGYASSTSLNNLSTTLTDNYINGPFDLTMVTVPAGGQNFGSSYTFTFPTFTYDPANGNLLLEIVAMNQDNVPNGSGNSYMESDDTGNVTSRAYCIAGFGCVATNDGLVTTFGTTSGGTTPEPSSLVMLGSGIVGLAGMLRRKLTA